MKLITSTTVMVLLFVIISVNTSQAQVTNSESISVTEVKKSESYSNDVTVIRSKSAGSRGGLSINVLGVDVKSRSRSAEYETITKTLTFDGDSILNLTRIVYAEPKNNLASSGHIGLIEFGFNALTSPDYSMYPSRTVDFMELNNARSQQWALRLFRVSGPLTRQGHLSFSTGLQMVWNNYTFSEDIYIYKGAGRVEYGMRNYKKSKLSTFGFKVPLLIEINLPQRFFVAFGGYGGVNVGTRSKVKFPKTIIRDPYINNFYGGVTARVGYGAIGVFANYDLTNLFKKNKGPETSVFTFGLSIGM